MNSKPETMILNREPLTFESQPSILNPKHRTLNPEPKTLHPAPTPCTHTLHPKPYTLYPTPYTEQPRTCSIQIFLNSSPYSPHLSLCGVRGSRCFKFGGLPDQMCTTSGPKVASVRQVDCCWKGRSALCGNTKRGSR